MKIAIVLKIDENLFDKLRIAKWEYDKHLKAYNKSNKSAIFEYRLTIAEAKYEKVKRRMNRHLKKLNGVSLSEIVADFGHKVKVNSEII